MPNVATHNAAAAYVLEFSNPAWSIIATSAYAGEYYTVECIPSDGLVGAEYWEGHSVPGHALTAAIMLAQLKQARLALRGAVMADLSHQARSLPADMPRWWE